VPSPHYTQSGKPRSNVFGSSQDMRDEFEAIEAGMEVMNGIPFVFMDWNNTGAGGDIFKYFAFPFDCEIKYVHLVNVDQVHASIQTTHQIVRVSDSQQVEFSLSNGSPWPNMTIGQGSFAAQHIQTYVAVENYVFDAYEAARWLSSSTDTTTGLVTMVVIELKRI